MLDSQGKKWENATRSHYRIIHFWAIKNENRWGAQAAKWNQKSQLQPPEVIIESFILISHLINPSQMQYIMVILC